MKPIKMFGLAALAALMAMAFVGASSAMATGLLPCAKQWKNLARQGTSSRQSTKNR